MQEMKEQIKNEIEKYAEVVGISVDEANAIFNDIVTEHGLDIETNNGLLVARSVFRSKFGQSRARMKKETEGDDQSPTEYSGPKTQKAKGFFYAIEAARDWEEYRRNTLLAEYQRDSSAALSSGTIAIAVGLDEGYEVTKSVEGELVSKVISKLPDDSPMEVDEAKWIIPIDNRKAFQSGQANPKFGKPLPKESWSRRLFFIGMVGDSADYSVYQLRLKDNLAKDFCPDTYKWCEFDCVPNSNSPNLLYGRKDGSTLNSLTYFNSEDANGYVLDIALKTLEHMVSPLVALETYHNDNSHKQSHERLVITNGNVANMNLQTTSNGNRTLFISDLNADFDYDEEGYSSIPCWVPEHINIDFGIGSNVVITGRTSQREVDGQLTNVSINVLGIHVENRHGSAQVDLQPSEDNIEWFD